MAGQALTIYAGFYIGTEEAQMNHPGTRLLVGPIHREQVRDKICPNYTASFQNVFDSQSNWITSSFTVTAASPLSYFDFALAYSEDGGQLYESKVQTTAEFDVANKLTV